MYIACAQVSINLSSPLPVGHLGKHPQDACLAGLDVRLDLQAWWMNPGGAD